MSSAAFDRPTRGFVLDAFGTPEVLSLTERETVPPGPGEVLVDVEVSGVNFADTMIRRGEYLRDQPLSLGPGMEVVGHVAAAGDGASLEPGTRVAAWIEAGGAYADRVIAPEHRAYPVPDDVAAADVAAVFLQGTTAHYALHRFGRIEPSETVLVLGASGGVGGIAIQLTVAAGGRAIGAASTESKRAIALGLGAAATVDSSAPDSLTDRVRERTAGQGVDIVVDGVGGALFEPSLRTLAVDGRYVIVGSASQEPATLDARRLLVRNQMICGFILAHITATDPEEPRRTLLELCRLIDEGILQPRYEVVPLEDAPDVHRRIEDRSLTGKVILEVRA